MVTPETPCLNDWVHSKSQFREKKNRYYQLGNFRLLYHSGMQYNVTTPYYPSFIFWRLIYKKKEYFKLLSLKEQHCRLREAVAFKKFQWLDVETFGILKNWSLLRGGRNRRFDCIQFCGVSWKQRPLRPQRPLRLLRPLRPLRPQRPLRLLRPLRPQRSLRPQRPLRPLRPLRPQRSLRLLRPWNFDWYSRKLVSFSIAKNCALF